MASSSSANAYREKQRIATITIGERDDLRINYLDRHCPDNVTQKGTILLIHGFPQTHYQFRKVITPLSQAGYRIIAPDYRGAGQSSRPVTGYEKTQMAKDLLVLVRQHLEIEEKIHVVGHDIGGMVAFAYASRYPEHVKSVIWGECPLPGSTFYEQYKGTPELFHFMFHRIPDLPEALIAGREQLYLKHFFDKLGFNSAGISKDDLDYYTTAFSQPGAMRAGINVYRAFEKDAEENREFLKSNGKCKVPALALSGGNCFIGAFAGDMFKEFHTDVEVAVVEEAGHWIAEENPEMFVEKVLGFVKKQEGR